MKQILTLKDIKKLDKEDARQMVTDKLNTGLMPKKYIPTGNLGEWKK